MYSEYLEFWFYYKNNQYEDGIIHETTYDRQLLPEKSWRNTAKSRAHKPADQMQEASVELFEIKLVRSLKNEL